MNVLEIYPNFSWWLDGRNEQEIQALRAAAEINEPEAQAQQLEALAPARAFHLSGDASGFDLIPEIFDEIIVRYSPTALKRLMLERRMGMWLKSNGVYRFSPSVLMLQGASNENENDYVPLRVCHQIKRS